ncbi:MAG: hypothetical protein WBC44_02445 [Planctomycetaceae bacterium]
MRRLIASTFLFMTLAGCDGAAPAPSAAPADAEASWSDQVDAVRGGRAAEIRLAATVTSEQFRELSTECDGLTALVLERAQLDDADLAVLTALPHLRWIKLPSPVGDEGVAIIGRCEVLEIVNLPAAVFTDAGLSHLAKLDRLELLRFSSPNVTDAGLKELPRLPRLKFLHLLDVPMTDAGLQHVAAVETLESFYLDGETGATDDGLRRLLAERPDLHFHKDQQHLPGDPNVHRHE